MITTRNKDNKEEYTYIRETVFMEEQGFTNEFDDIDAVATHITLYEDDELVGCARVFPINESEYKVGRIAILQEFRKKGYGSILIKACEKQVRVLGGTSVTLDAQVRAQGFYEVSGYVAFGEVHLDEGEPHIFMKKQLQTN